MYSVINFLKIFHKNLFLVFGKIEIVIIKIKTCYITNGRIYLTYSVVGICINLFFTYILKHKLLKSQTNPPLIFITVIFYPVQNRSSIFIYCQLYQIFIYFLKFN